MPRTIYDTALQVSKNKNVTQAVATHFDIVSNDPSIESFGFVRNVKDKEFLFCSPREDYGKFICPIHESVEDDKKVVIQEKQQLRLLKVVLEKGVRKWEFVWNGIKIPAPVLDDNFWENMRLQKIRITQGDSIIADIKIHQVLDPYSRIFFNERYEIINVRDHVGSYKQDVDLFVAFH